MASSRVQDHRNVNPTKPAALTKAVPRCVPATSTGCHSVLSGVRDADTVRRTRKGAREDGKFGGQAAKGIKSRIGATTRSALSGVENIDTTSRAKGNGVDEGSRQAKGKTKATTRAPKTATVRPLNKQPLPSAKAEVTTTHRSVTTRASNATAAAQKVQVTRKTRSQATSTITEVPTEQFSEMNLMEEPDLHTSRRYVTTRSKTTNTRDTAHVPHKAKKPTKMTIHPLLAERTNTTHNQIENFAPQGKGKSGPPEEEVDIGRELVPYEPVADIDLTTDPSMCGEYAGDIYTYHRQLEEQGHYLVCATFLNHQKDINSGHRRVLVDWLAQVHYKYHLLQETMLLTVDILDRYLQIAIVSKSKLQLVGIASLFISSKYEEIYAPSIHELEHIAAHTYSQPEILSMERTILHELDYRLLKPYPIHFLRRYSRLSHTDTNVHHLAKYFIDLSLLECEGSALLPSKKAAAAFILAKTNLYGCTAPSVWTGRLTFQTGYSLAQLLGTLRALQTLVENKHTTDKAKAIRERYIRSAPTEEMKALLKGDGLGLKL